jgi:dTDP-4-amino-4,6-dideoxy-D-glucose acyltransferase
VGKLMTWPDQGVEVMSEEFDYGKLNAIGSNVFISKTAEIRRPNLVSVGNNVAIDSGFYLTTAAQIGNYVHIGPYVSCIGGAEASITIGNFVGVAAGARFICLGDEQLGSGLVGPVVPEKYRDKKVGGEIVLSQFSSIGTNAIVFPGVFISEGSVVGAGSVVTKDTRPWTVYVGNPARPVRAREKDTMLKFAHEIFEENSKS